jgi:hypothetical protein
LNTVSALRTRAAFAAAVYAGFTQFWLPDTVDTVVTSRTVGTAAVNKLFTVIQNMVITVWWNFVIVVQTAIQQEQRENSRK